MTPAIDLSQIEELEARLLLEGIFQQYGYDLRGYSFAAVRHWIQRRLAEEGLAGVSGLQERILREPACMERFLLTVADNGPSVFRDPDFYLTFRRKIAPFLRTYPTVRIWHAGCGLGEEVYSLAILLQEEGLYERCQIYATDQSQAVIDMARAGSFPLSRKETYARNYEEAGGKGSLSDYCTRSRDHVRFHGSLKKNVTFATHCLATDGVFNELQVIFCRNVLGACAQPLQERLGDLLHRSLSLFGFLGLGNSESISMSPYELRYEELDNRNRLYRKVQE